MNTPSEKSPETPKELVMAILPGATTATEVDSAKYVFATHEGKRYAFPKTKVVPLESPKLDLYGVSKVPTKSDIADHLRNRTSSKIFGE